MNRHAKSLMDLAELPPKTAAETLVALQRKVSGNAVGEQEPVFSDDWLGEFTTRLGDLCAGKSLQRILSVWGLNQSEAARLLGITRQALSKWLKSGVPVGRSADIADLAAATDLLVHYLKRDRIPAVVRRPMKKPAEQSLLGLLGEGDTKAVLDVCRNMFDFAAVHH